MSAPFIPPTGITLKEGSMHNKKKRVVNLKHRKAKNKRRLARKVQKAERFPGFCFVAIARIFNHEIESFWMLVDKLGLEGFIRFLPQRHGSRRLVTMTSQRDRKNLLAATRLQELLDKFEGQFEFVKV